jgi:hypothetical protein
MTSNSISQLKVLIENLQDVGKNEESVVKFLDNLKNDEEFKIIFETFGWNASEKKFSSDIYFDHFKAILTNKLHSLNDKVDNNDDNDAAKSFLPHLLINQLKQNISRKRFALSVNSKFFEGVILLVDISGFSNLNAKKFSKGKAGIEDLHQNTNIFMGKLVRLIYAFNGDIVKFAGDVIICVFHSTDNYKKTTLKNLAINALYCAIGLREVEITQLHVNVAIGAGEICFGILGGYNNTWEYLVSGKTLTNLLQCIDDSNRQQITIDQEFFNLFDDCQLDVEVVHFGCNLIVKSKKVVKNNDKQNIEMSIRNNSYSDNLKNKNSNGEKKEISNDSTEKVVDIENSSNKNYNSDKNESRNNDGSTNNNSDNDIKTDDIINNDSKTNEASNNDDEKKKTNETLVNTILNSNLTTTTITNKTITTTDNYTIHNKSSNRVTLQTLVTQFVPRPILNGLQLNTFEFLTQFREATILFLKFDSYDTELHHDVVELQACFLAVQNILNLTGGFLRQFLIDDKGLFYFI